MFHVGSGSGRGDGHRANWRRAEAGVRKSKKLNCRDENRKVSRTLIICMRALRAPRPRPPRRSARRISRRGGRRSAPLTPHSERLHLHNSPPRNIRLSM
ncbi:hypothetical protein EVAR_8994_1 [Eumeta japonica]|uniref:Uncharacterized protein n=1 Tax=Eumeta variegata TaxID=151549 RepID=A0A4C1WSX1_EUMVA|nr:hypothetical protein EVAR_8994_1 [Eumeta japonica]